MNRKIFFGRSLKDILVAATPSLVFAGLAFFVVYKFVDPAPPKHLVISTGSDEGDYQAYAKLYQDIFKSDGVNLEILPSTGGIENLKRLKDPKSGVDAGFVQDGLGNADRVPGVVSLGSLYYEPLWIFYRGKREIGRFSQLAGKRVALGERGGGARVLALRLLKASGIDDKKAHLFYLEAREAADALKKGEVDAAIFLGTPEDPLITALFENRDLRMMSLDQAEAITRKYPYLHHLVLPHGAIDLAGNIPSQDVHLVSPTATLLVRNKLHPALVYLLLKAASEVHKRPGIFEKKDEFPIDKDYAFPLSNDAQHFYRNGIPFWQRYLPFWLATLVDRFVLLVIPSLALIFPMVRLIPRILEWRVKSRIYHRYGELKFLETQIKPGSTAEMYADYLGKLDGIEERVNHMKVLLDFSDHIYVLREHIEFVRRRLQRVLGFRQRVE